MQLFVGDQGNELRAARLIQVVHQRADQRPRREAPISVIVRLADHVPDALSDAIQLGVVSEDHDLNQTQALLSHA